LLDKNVSYSTIDKKIKNTR